jgi:hypothetical protein
MLCLTQGKITYQWTQGQKLFSVSGIMDVRCHTGYQHLLQFSDEDISWRVERNPLSIPFHYLSFTKIEFEGYPLLSFFF